MIFCVFGQYTHETGDVQKDSHFFHRVAVGPLLFLFLLLNGFDSEGRYAVAVAILPRIGADGGVSSAPIRAFYNFPRLTQPAASGLQGASHALLDESGFFAHLRIGHCGLSHAFLAISVREAPSIWLRLSLLVCWPSQDLNSSSFLKRSFNASVTT